MQRTVQPDQSHNRSFILHEEHREGGLMLIGYMRVSKSDGSQVLDLQRDALLSANVDPNHIYEDLTSGRRDDRPGLAVCLKALREGDTLVVWKLDRLGRDLRHLINTVYDLSKRSVGFTDISRPMALYANKGRNCSRRRRAARDDKSHQDPSPI
jgi:DNA invertase Pin-like site-specific DNA recombinase